MRRVPPEPPIMQRPLEALHDGLIHSIGLHIAPGRGLLDPVRGTVTPPDHYGNTAAALGLQLHDAESWPLALHALQAWEATPANARGHHPFNRLLLVLLARALAHRGAPDEQHRHVFSISRMCPLETSYPSNNWTLLAQTCRLLEAPLDLRAHEAARMCEMLAGWTTRAGGFIDFPVRPQGRMSTPIAYHHKALFLAALAWRTHPSAALATHAQRLLDWLIHCWDPAGFAGGLGRSNHALFGDACLIAGLLLLGGEQARFRNAAEAIAGRLARQRRGDGLLWLVPGDPVSETTAWDDYMHLSVYNAWAGAVIGIALHAARLGLDQPERCGFQWRADSTGHFHDPEAGLLGVRTADGLCAVMTTRGQLPQSFSSCEAEFRYGGGQMMHLHHPQGGLLVAPPVRVSVAAIMECPELAGWTPLFSSSGRLFALSDFDEVSIFQDGVYLRIELTGSPTELLRPRPDSLWAQLLAGADWRLFGSRLSRKAVFNRRSLATVRARLTVTLHTENPIALTQTLQVELAPSSATTLLNPRGHRTGKSTWLQQYLPDPSGTDTPSTVPPQIRACAGQALAPGPTTLSLTLKWTPIQPAHTELARSEPHTHSQTG